VTWGTGVEEGLAWECAGRAAPEKPFRQLGCPHQGVVAGRSSKWNKLLPGRQLAERHEFDALLLKLGDDPGEILECHLGPLFPCCPEGTRAVTLPLRSRAKPPV